METVTFKVNAKTATGFSFPIQFWAQHANGEVKAIYTVNPDLNEQAPRECHNAFKSMEEMGLTLELSMDIVERAELAAKNEAYRI